ncbi:MAG: restriction endonuclease [Proteobacteria bacterium]|nr:restriction endonuclease [Pseudomonadota bacterium]
MAIPDYQALMLPLLKLAASGQADTLSKAEALLADEFGLTPDECAARLPSGQQSIIRNRIGWASTYLKSAGLLERPRRGVFRITDKGQQVIASRPARIDVKFLQQFPEFNAFHGREATGEDKPRKNEPTHPAPVQTPEEVLQGAYQTIRDELAGELLERLTKARPEFFERIVVELLVAMGYGGSREDAGERLGRSGDGGIDGIIKEDRLGLDAIYIQAKRWQGTVGRPEIQKFVGALTGQRAQKGVFMTTSAFSSEAVDYVSRIDKKVVLLDGGQIAQLMIDHDVGVSLATSFVVKKVDSDYFEEA